MVKKVTESKKRKREDEDWIWTKNEDKRWTLTKAKQQTSCNVNDRGFFLLVVVVVCY